MSNYSDKIAITTGDPNSIGPEVTIKALNALNLPADNVVLISNKKILDTYGKLNNDYEIIEIPFAEEVQPGKTTKGCGDYAYESLKKVCEIRPKAIVTAPVSKYVLCLAGHFYSGQTEILQKFLANEDQKAEMFFVANDFRVLLLSRHCALKEIDLTKEEVVSKIVYLQEFFRNKLNIPKPKFALCGFNPHAGEDGILGMEEKVILIPAVRELIDMGIDISLPQPADALFIGAGKAYLKPHKMPYDCYIACYHDQGLIPIKMIAGIKAVNMTIGLDIVRTSPGHGTAFDIAGKNIANEAGMIEAIKAVL